MSYMVSIPSPRGATQARAEFDEVLKMNAVDGGVKVVGRIRRSTAASLLSETHVVSHGRSFRGQRAFANPCFA